MKKFATGLTALLICGALNFGAAEAAETFDAPEFSAEENLSADMNLPETEELRRHHRPDWYEPPPPPPPHHRPGFGGPRDHHYGPPPPPSRHPGFGPRDPYGPPPPFRR